jgi:hypothetical protein
MAKVSLKAITPIKKVDPQIIKIGEQEVEVIQYLPVNDKLALVERVLNLTIDDTGFLNPVRLEVYAILEIVKTYTNISITDKMMENAPGTYDLLMINGVLDHVIAAIPEDEYDAIFDAIEDCAEHTVKYLNSFVGMIKTVTNDYDATKMNVEEIMETLDQPDKIGLVKDILDKIG